MARPLRVVHAGGWYHVTARGNERRDIFRDDGDRRHFLELLEGMVGMFGLRLHVFVLMPNHYHLLLELTEANLSRAVHWLNVSYTVWFNRRHQRSGHLFQGRFKSVLVEREQWGLGLSRYLHLNPVRVRRLGLGKEQLGASRSIGIGQVDRQLVKARVEELRRYPWSSLRAYYGIAKAPSWLTRGEVLALGGRAGDRAKRYQHYCEEPLAQGWVQSPWQEVVGQAILGSERFVAQWSGHLEKSDGKGRWKQRPRLEEAIGAVEAIWGEKWEVFRDRYGDLGRDLALYLGRTGCGLGFRELSEAAGIDYVSAAAAVRRFRQRAQNERKIANLLRRASAKMHNE